MCDAVARARSFYYSWRAAAPRLLADALGFPTPDTREMAELAVRRPLVEPAASAAAKAAQQIGARAYRGAWESAALGAWLDERVGGAEASGGGGGGLDDLVMLPQKMLPKFSKIEKAKPPPAKKAAKASGAADDKPAPRRRKKDPSEEPASRAQKAAEEESAEERAARERAARERMDAEAADLFVEVDPDAETWEADDADGAYDDDGATDDEEWEEEEVVDLD